MMKNIINKKTILTAGLLVTMAIFSNIYTENIAKKGNVYYHKIDLSKTTLSQQMVALMNAHQQLLNQIYSDSFLKEKQLTSLHKTFFSDLSFSAENSFESFFRNIEANIQKIGNSTQYGQSMVSYTKMIVLDGQYSAVSYSMVSDGKSIQVSKQANINGEVLKANYEYNTNGKLLKVNEFKNNKLIESSSHTVKI